jgi:hypothetical protein
VLSQQLPHAGTHIIKTEISLISHVEEHNLVPQGLTDDVVTDLYPICGHNENSIADPVENIQKSSRTSV